VGEDRRDPGIKLGTDKCREPYGMDCEEYGWEEASGQKSLYNKPVDLEHGIVGVQIFIPKECNINGRDEAQPLDEV
jgi:hypothetical protein